jgi:hypothetical protein
MSRNVAAGELQELIEMLQNLSARGARLAQASGDLVNPMWFNGIHTAAVMAAGELDSKGLLLRKDPSA